MRDAFGQSYGIQHGLYEDDEKEYVFFLINFG